MNIHQHRLGDTQLLESSFAEKDLGGQQIETEFLVRSSQDERQQAQTEIQQIAFKHSEALYWECG